jgi:hypothetical protein
MGDTHSEALSKFFAATQSNTQIVARPPHVSGLHGTMILNLWQGLCQVTAIDVQSSFNLQNYFENPLAKFFFGLLAVHTKGRYFASMLHLGCNFGFNQCWPIIEKTPGYQLGYWLSASWFLI